MAPSGHYHADSDADDEYERSILTSPMPHTDDENSSNGDTDPGSHEHTPTTFDGPDYDRNSPRTVITEWTTDECASFLSTMGLDQYSKAFRENEIVGEALIALKHDELKEMGVTSVGHRLTILKGVYDVKVRQDVPIDSEHYVPLSAEDSTRNKQVTQDDITRIIQSLQMRDQRILEAEAELRRIQEEYRKLRQELLPLWVMSKEKNESLPSPVGFNQQPPSLGRKPSKNKNNLSIGAVALKNPNSPTHPSTTSSDTISHSSSAVSVAGSYLQAIAGIDINTSPHMSSPGASPGVPQQQSIQQPAYNSGLSAGYPQTNTSYMAGPQINDHRPSIASQYLPSSARGRPAMSSTSIREPVDDGSAPAVEIYKSFRVSLEDPCHKVLPAALKKYNIQADWRQYALYIVYGDQERCLGLEEKPLTLFKQLDKEGRKPMFMLRKHVTPMEGHIRSTAGDHALGDHGMSRNQSQIQLPGGML